MKAKLSPEKNVLKIEMSREQMMLFGGFFKEKYFPLLDHDRFWWLVHFSRFLHSQSIDIQWYYKALYRDTNP